MHAMARCAPQEGYTAPGAPRAPRIPVSPAAKFIRRVGATVWLCPRGIPNYDIEREHCSRRAVNVRHREIVRRQGTGLLYLRYLLNGAHFLFRKKEVRGKKKKKVFSLHAAICPGSPGMSFRVCAETRNAISQCDEHSLVRIVGSRPCTRFHSCARTQCVYPVQHGRRVDGTAPDTF